MRLAKWCQLIAEKTRVSVTSSIKTLIASRNIPTDARLTSVILFSLLSEASTQAQNRWISPLNRTGNPGPIHCGLGVII
jgi:hypothetical protein